MKKLFVLLFLFSTYCFSQTFEVKYYENELNTNIGQLKETQNNLHPAFKKNFYSYKLVTDENQSFYKNEKIVQKFEKDDISLSTMVTESGDTIKTFVSSSPYDTRFKEKYIYKDFRKSKIYEELFFNQKYSVYDNILDWKWEILNETEIILGYKCKKAKSKSYGSDVIAWFTEDIPIANGPARFNGLPGLILKIKLPFLEINAYEIEFKKEKINIEQPPVLDQKNFTYDDLMKKINSIGK